MEGIRRRCRSPRPPRPAAPPPTPVTEDEDALPPHHLCYLVLFVLLFSALALGAAAFVLYDAAHVAFRVGAVVHHGRYVHANGL